MEFKPIKYYGHTAKVDLFDRFQSLLANSITNDKVYLYAPSNNGSPFMVNGCALFYDDALWNELELTEFELFAILLHEIGHSVDNSSRVDDAQHQQLREDNADDYAYKYGFGRHLYSALNKLVQSERFTEQENESMTRRQNRIEYMLNHPYSHLHADARNKWIEELEANMPRILATPLMNDRRRILEDIASRIKGVGQVSIDKALAEIESEHYQ